MEISQFINSEFALYEWMRKSLWAGAKDRWEGATEEMKSQVISRLWDWAEDSSLSDTTINDYVWFECDDIFFPDEVADFTDLTFEVEPI